MPAKVSRKRRSAGGGRDAGIAGKRKGEWAASIACDDWGSSVCLMPERLRAVALGDGATGGGLRGGVFSHELADRQSGRFRQDLQ